MFKGKTSLELDLSNYDALVFDLDHCLVEYHQSNLSDLVHYCIFQFLVNDENYPAYIKDFSFQSSIADRGVILCSKTGNLLWLDKSLNVLKTVHGFEEVNSDSLTLTNKDLLSTNNQYFPIPTYFERAIASAFCVLVHLHDTHNLKPVTTHSRPVRPLKGKYSSFLLSILNAMKFNFWDFHSGYYYREFEKDPFKYVKVNKNVGNWLRSMKAVTSLGLITNSTKEYACFLLKNCLGFDWSEFDFAIFKAGKPYFWTSDHNLGPIADCLTKKSEKLACRCLMVGDHPIGDVALPSQIGIIDMGAIRLKFDSLGIVEDECVYEDEVIDAISFKENYFFEVVVQNSLFFTSSISNLLDYTEKLAIELYSR
ncbi:hypothetical protein GEMRC1_002724 [Eukaryota sp. GEM-RC1]